MRCHVIYAEQSVVLRNVEFALQSYDNIDHDPSKPLMNIFSSEYTIRSVGQIYIK